MSSSRLSRGLHRRVAKTRLLLKTPWPVLLDKAGLMRRPYAVTWDKDITVELRPGVHGERYVFYEVIMKSAYFSSGQVLRPGDSVIDIGANVGFFAIQAAARVGPTGSVIAFEPHPETFKQLQRNIAVSGMRHIRARQAAVTDQAGSIDLFFGDTPSYSSVFHSVDAQPRGAATVTVPTTTVDDIMRDEGLERCHYLKIDCEGSEYAICESLSAEAARRIEQITMEVHRVAGHEVSSLERALARFGFELSNREKLFTFTRADR